MKQDGFTLTELLLAIVVVFIIPALIIGVSLWTGRNLDFWLTHFKGHIIHVPFWLDFILTISLNGFIFVCNIVGEIARLAI